MLMPSIFGENLFDDFMDFPFGYDFWGKRNPAYGTGSKNLMKTDIRETEDSYELDIDLPGFKKEEIKAQLENGYLTISAAKNMNKDEKDKEGKYIRQERYAGAMSRSYYVGQDVTQEDVKAKFEDGILKMTIPRMDKRPEVEQRKNISIQG